MLLFMVFVTITFDIYLGVSYVQPVGPFAQSSSPFYLRSDMYPKVNYEMCLGPAGQFIIGMSTRLVAYDYPTFSSSILVILTFFLFTIFHFDYFVLSLKNFFQFFTANPLPCDPSSLPKYQPSKEFDAKRREEESRRYFSSRTLY